MEERFSPALLKKKIADRGWTNAEFTRRLIVAAGGDLKPSQSYVYAILRGEIANIGADYLTLLAKLFNCPRDEFFSPRVS